MLGWQATVTALAVLPLLAPAEADQYIGCLFTPSVCINSLEWCFDDLAFGRCVPLTGEDLDHSTLYRYELNSEQLGWLEGELQSLSQRGYAWEHAYAQCVLQAMLYTIRNKLSTEEVNVKICLNFVDPKLEKRHTVEDGEIEDNQDESAFIRFTPDSDESKVVYANEVYTPPILSEDELSYDGLESNENVPYFIDEEPSDKLRDILFLNGENNEVKPLPFEGFRERLQTERKDVGNIKKNKDIFGKEKKGFVEDVNPVDDDQKDGNYYKMKLKIPPNSAEFITSNRYSPLDDKIRSNALEKYKHSFMEKEFPFEYENQNNEIPEQRIYFDEDGGEDYRSESGSGELDPFQSREVMPLGSKAENTKNMQYLINYWEDLVNSKIKPQRPFYAEGGPLDIDYSDVGVSSDGKLHEREIVDHNFNYDPSYAYVLFKNRFLTNWNKGVAFISTLENMLGLEKNTFTNPRVDPSEVTFKVESNSKNYNAADVARRIVGIKEQLRRRTGAQILSTGVGDKRKYPIVHHMESDEYTVFGVELPIVLALAGSLAVLIAGAAVFTVLLRRDINAKAKLQGLASATEIDTEATRDYQELCRARMSGKWSGQPPEPSARTAALARDPDALPNSPSTRSSTSSWSEEPALTNMDISTGHMVLAYMEDHLRNKDRLEQEWQALCAYEAEPCATTHALKLENTGKNRYPDVLPYDHSRVTLSSLTNHLGSDYINASTITDHDPRNPAYVAAAGPLAHTAPDFWQMVWEQGSVVMVMLTRLTENGQQLCHRYWPEDGSELYHIYEVHLVSEHIWCDDYLVRSFYLKNQQTSETRTVTQFHFLSWPENGVPASTKALLEFRRKVNKSYRGRSCPIVVHCSDGAGRTGTYCLIDMVLNRMAKGAKEIDIAATLEHIRDQRPRTVATRQQFEFVLMAVAEEVHAILKALPAHLQQLNEKKDKEKDKDCGEKNN